MTYGENSKGAEWFTEHLVERVKQLEAELEAEVFIGIRGRLVRAHLRGGFDGAPVTTGDLLEIHRMQEGRCRYTGLGYMFSAATRAESGSMENPLRVTVDRLDPAKGWTRENVVLCALFASVARNGWPMEMMAPLWRFLPGKVSV